MLPAPHPHRPTSGAGGAGYSRGSGRGAQFAAGAGSVSVCPVLLRYKKRLAYSGQSISSLAEFLRLNGVPSVPSSVYIVHDLHVSFPDRRSLWLE